MSFAVCPFYKRARPLPAYDLFMFIRESSLADLGPESDDHPIEPADDRTVGRLRLGDEIDDPGHISLDEM